MDNINFKEIPELETLRRVDDFSDAVRLSAFVYNLIPHDSSDKQSLDIEAKSLLEYYRLFKEKKFFGWCHSNALYLHMLFKKYGRESYVYNYGLRGSDFTHVVVVVTIKEDQFLLDPYFNRYYVDEEKNPLNFNELLKLIYTTPEKVGSIYGEEKKLVYSEEKKSFVGIHAKDFEGSVLNAWRVLSEFDKIMIEEFNNLNPLLLITRKIEKTNVLMKLNGEPYFEFY